ncbi:hypothetical protein ACSBR2_005188 [Camellia fascicularis]
MVAFLVLVVLLIRYFTGNTEDEHRNQEFNRDKTKANDVMNTVVRILTAAIMIVVVAILEGVDLNTTSEVYRQLSTAIPKISESPTELAILSWVMFDLAIDIDELKQGHEILHVEAFNSEKKRSGVLTRINGKKIHARWKEAAEMILSMCSNYYTKNGNIIPMNDKQRPLFEMIINDMAAKSLRCITLVTESVEVSRKIEETRLTLLRLVSLKDPTRPSVRATVQACRDTRVNVKMITGDNIFTAKAIAIESGIVKPNEDSSNAMVEGVTFRNYSDEERMEKINTIRVMARSSPFDKLVMVKCLKRKGHVVAVIWDGTNNAPALKEVDIGLSMEIHGTELAKESSDIVILDDNFTSVVTVLKWGRCVYNNIQKFIQFNSPST